MFIIYECVSLRVTWPAWCVLSKLISLLFGCLCASGLGAGSGSGPKQQRAASDFGMKTGLFFVLAAAMTLFFASGNAFSSSSVCVCLQERVRVSNSRFGALGDTRLRSSLSLLPGLSLQPS